MHKRNSINNVPLLIGIVLSLALHGAALYSKDIYTPPIPTMAQGRTAVHLTLVPSIASQAAIPESPPELPMEQPDEAPAPVEKTVPPEAVAEFEAVDSIEQDATVQEDKGVSAEASLAGPLHPPYPRISKLRGETGTVRLAVHVLADGSVANVEILQSSGYRRLDEAAQKAVRKTTFIPAMRFGRNIDSETERTITFRLTND